MTFRLSAYARMEWLTILAVGLLLTIAALIAQWWILAGIFLLVTLLLLGFFRDPHRTVPTQRGVVVAPADGRVVSVYELDHYEPFDGPAQCVRIFIGLTQVHVARSPCHGNVRSFVHKPGKHANAANPQSMEDNESVQAVLEHPIRQYPVASVRLIAGLLARTIACPLEVDQTVQRGQRIGMIKLGSAAELYLPLTVKPQISIREGQHVKAGQTVIASISALDQSTSRNDEDPTPPEPDQIEKNAANSPPPNR